MLRALFAADWLEVIIFAFIVISSILGQIYKVWQERAEKKKGELKPVELPDMAAEKVGKGRPQAGPIVDDPLRREIRDFVQRPPAGRPPAEFAPTEIPGTPPPSRTRQGSRPLPSDTKKRAGAKRAAGGQAGKRPPVVRPAAPRGEGVAEHVQRHIQASDVGDHAAQLGSALGQADERLESRLHATFDHRLGTLAKEPVGTQVAEGTDNAAWRPTAVSGGAIAPQVVAILRSHKGLAAALVVHEILRRPEERWEKLGVADDRPF